MSTPAPIDLVDRARAQYVRRLYCVSIDDPGLFHLQIDSTALSLDACADLIATAYTSLITTPETRTSRIRREIPGRNDCDP